MSGPIQSAIQLLSPQRVHLYSQGWWGSPSHINIGYRSDDPNIIARQVISAKAVLAPATLDTCVDWYGPTEQPNNTYCQFLQTESEKHGAQFSIMIDKGAKGDGSTLLAYLRENYFKSPAYAKLNGKHMVWSFAAQPSVVDLLAKQTDIILFTENSGANSYAWPNGFAPDTPQTYLERYLKRQDASMIPCLWHGFDDHKKSNPAVGAWGGKPRLMSPGTPTGWELWNSLVALIKTTGKHFKDIGIATLDDYEERTRIEPFILQEYAAIFQAEAEQLLAAN